MYDSCFFVIWFARAISLHVLGFSQKVINIFLYVEDSFPWLYFLVNFCVSLLGHSPHLPFKWGFSGNIECKKYQFKEEKVLFIEAVCCKLNPRWRGASVIVSDISLVGVGPDGLSQHTAQLECEAFDLSFDLCFSSHSCWATNAAQRILQAWVASSFSLPIKKWCNAATHWKEPLNAKVSYDVSGALCDLAQVQWD